ncbi:hypothetical protein HBO19_08375 [Pseudomonas sp. WS 5021]|nr:hypothetical protein [Pseudomonas sp. WS 5021]
MIRDPTTADLRQQLNALVKLQPDHSERAERARQTYDQLKAHLMLARPDKADADLLVKTLANVESSALVLCQASGKPCHPRFGISMASTWPPTPLGASSSF